MLSALCLITHPFTAAKDTGRGIERYAYELFSRLNNKRIDVSIAEAEYHNSLLKAAIKEITFPFKLVNASADIYHAICPAGAKTAIMLGKSPIVTTIHDMIPFHFKSDYEYSWLYEYHRFCIKLSATKSDRLIVPFSCIKEELVSRFKVPNSKIKVIRYGIDPSIFRPLSDVKKQGMIKKILFVGSITRSKGVDVLIKAFSIVTKEIKNVELLLGGKEVGGRKRKDQVYIKELPHKLGMADKVKFLGFIPEAQLPVLYNNADVAVFPSNYGFGLPVIEAMACGTPTVAGASLDGPEGYGDAAVLVKSDDADQLAEAILRVLTDEKLKKDLIVKGIERSRLFSLETMTEEVVEVYKSLN